MHRIAKGRKCSDYCPSQRPHQKSFPIVNVTLQAFAFLLPLPKIQSLYLDFK